MLAEVTVDTTQFAAGWGTVALVNANLAQAKGSSGLVWFLISLLLGPIATFLLLFVEPTPEPAKE
ncbi:MAG: hypothetical protein ACYTGN_08755 [Planctomycetota bacterium]|jgi:hypothetical protein